jgi:8-oxoguanine deaminase
MATLLLKNADVLVTMDATRREMADGWAFARDGVIESIGPGPCTLTADTVVDATGSVVIPGLVNTHHHLFQTLTRAVPAAQDAPLFGWLKTLYPIWTGLGAEHIHVSAQVGMAEMMLSGCTTSSDHLYLFPNGARLDDEIAAAREIGLRFTATRGSMSIGESKGGLPPDRLTEREDDILADCERVIGAFHDGRRHSMLHVALAPCSPFSVSRDLMRDSARLARKHGVRLHTHLAENAEDVNYSIEKFGVRPGQYAEDLEWVGPDVWHAHCVQLDAGEIALFGRTKTGVAHCPCSNMRLASGIAPVVAMLAAGVQVGLGVDGSASSDSGHLLAEARQAMLLQRVLGGAAAFSARAALELATRGGAEVLGRDDIGHLAPGMSADFAVYGRDDIAVAGGDWDPVAALVLCGPLRAKHTIVAGKTVVRDGVLMTLDLPRLAERQRALVRKLMT